MGYPTLVIPMLPVGAVYQNKAFFRKYVATYVYRTAERVGVLYHNLYHNIVYTYEVNSVIRPSPLLYRNSLTLLLLLSLVQFAPFLFYEIKEIPLE